jgi:hypothetical protein
MKKILISLRFVLLLNCVQAHAQKSDIIPPHPGGPVDIAPFGFQVSENDGSAHGIRWAEPRKIRRVVVVFPNDRVLPDLSQIKLQYWHRVWDGKADPILAERSSGGVGWDSMDDWTNGQWKEAKTYIERNKNTFAFTFAPISETELKNLSGNGVSYRKTLWIRIYSSRILPMPQKLKVYTESVYKTLTVRIQFGESRKAAFNSREAETGHLEVVNGHVTAIRPFTNNPLRIDANLKWTMESGTRGAIEADLLMAVDPMDGRYDHTIVTVRSNQRPFSFAADEVARGDRILVDDMGILVTNDQDPITLSGYRDSLARKFRGKTVYDRVTQEPEQTLHRAWNDMPLKRPLWFVHGLPGNRNTMRQNSNGDIEVTSVRRWFDLQRRPRDSDRKLWDGDRLRISFGFPSDHLRGGRELKDGYLPLLRTWWQDGPIHYEQRTILGVPGVDPEGVALDTPTALLMQVRVVNVSNSETSTAKLLFSSRARQEEKLIVLKGRAFAATESENHLRFLFNTSNRGIFTEDGTSVKWALELKPGQSEHFQIVIPSITLLKEKEIEAYDRVKFEAEAAKICEFWKDLTSRGTQIHTPEAWINDFYKSHLRHLLINCFKELDTDLLHAHVGTFHYGVYPNESVMMISDLDRRGYHKQARQALNAFLHYQGTVSMPGNFKSKKGQFYGAGGHETGGYNKSHGYVMWNMAQHWLFTRDREWMEQAAPKLVEACEWVIRERRSTMVLNTDGTKPLEYGWLPSGSLEDVTDFWYWLATNSATVWGFRALADALVDYGHPEGARLQREAEYYYNDFMRGIRESRINCPVVRLRDETYVPKIPSRLYERGRAHGWLRETLEGAMFLPTYGLLAPDAPETLWILKDYEDNLYISEQYGYSIPAYEDFWFSRGGFSMQANLLDGPLPYLWRDDIKHYVRTYFNSFASAFYPEIRLCNEHSLPELGYPRGDHFKTSDEAQSTYWLRLMFLNEQGKNLYLGQAVPRYWLADGNHIGITRAASFFGQLSLRYESNAGRGKIRVILDPPQRNKPRTIFVRIRHPQSKPIKNVFLNDRQYENFDSSKEWIILKGEIENRQEIIAEY